MKRAKSVKLLAIFEYISNRISELDDPVELFERYVGRYVPKYLSTVLLSRHRSG
jgi:hypothetical protein